MIKLLLLAVVPFVTEHRYVTPRTEVTTNLYGSVTGVVDKTYILSQIGNSKVSDVQTNGVSIVNDGIANLKECDPTVPNWAKSALADPATVTTAGRAADALKVKEELAEKLDKSGGTLTGDLVISENKTLTVGTRKGQSGIYSVVEGNSNTANGSYSHSEGNNNIASGPYSHAEGGNNTASGPYSHAEGGNNAAKNRYEHAQGRYNVSHSSTNDAESTLFSIGAGTSASDHKNAIETMMDGKTFILGVGGYNGTNPTGQPNSAKDVATVIEGKANQSDIDRIEASVNNLSIEVEGKQDDVGIVNDGYTVVMPSDRSLAVQGNMYVTGNANISGSLNAPYITIDGAAVALRSDIPTVIDPADATTTGESADALAVKQALSGFVPWANAGHNAVTIGTRIDESFVGENGIAQGNYVRAEGDSSHAEGYYTHAEGTATHAEGYTTHAGGNFSHSEGYLSNADGVAAHAGGYQSDATNNYSYTWQGGYTSTRYGSHGDGTFNINPVGGLAGFWIGETNLAVHIHNIAPASYTPPTYLRVYDEVRQCWWRGKMVDGVMNWEVE